MVGTDTGKEKGLETVKIGRTPNTLERYPTTKSEDTETCITREKNLTRREERGVDDTTQVRTNSEPESLFQVNPFRSVEDWT